MSKKAILICVSVIVILLIGVAAAVSVLYSGTGAGKGSIDDSRYALFHAVPSDAVAVIRFDDLEKMTDILSADMPVAPFLESGTAEPLKRFIMLLKSSARMPLSSSGTALSLHYNGNLIPLLVIDAGRAGSGISEEADLIMDMADSTDMYSVFVDCSDNLSHNSRIDRRSVLILSPSDLIAKSAQRHLARNISITGSEGFQRAAQSVEGDNLLFVSGKNIDKITDRLMSRKYRRYSSFLADVADWNAFSIYSYGGSHIYLKGASSCVDGDADFINLLSSLQPAASEVSSVLPSYTVFAASVPMSDWQAYAAAYERFLDARSGTARLESRQNTLRKRTGTSPEDWAASLNIREVSVASFYAGTDLEQVIMVRTEPKKAYQFLFGDSLSVRQYAPRVHEYKYQGYAASLFGPMYSLEDETCFTFIDGWVISGSAVAVGEYVSGRALENTLKSYMQDAGLPDRLSGKDRLFVSYFSVTESDDALARIFSSDFAASLSASAEGISYEPVTLSVGAVKSSAEISLELDKVTVRKSKPPVFERDTLIEVPKGPFRVKNSGTGRMNLFYQQDNMYLCLQEESGKGIWGAPFDAPICGRAGTIDYFANGKLQILFASGRKLYLIDRLGRFVNPFPIDLGKNILLGPDIYDFNDSRRYNVMVLHTDNTIDMYNLQGQKPLQWKGITAEETIKNLPEPVKVGGRTYWVVRTSIRTLIFPFYGGESLTPDTGDKMIRTDSKVVPSDGSSVTVTCYDGKEHRIKL